MKIRNSIPRRSTLKRIGAAGAMSFMAPGAIHTASGRSLTPGKPGAQGNSRDIIFDKVFSTPFIDTHEHLIEEKGRLAGSEHPRVPSDDWSLLLSHYTNSDLITAGMPQADYERFFSPDVDPIEKWRIVAPWWRYIKNTGYGQATEIAMRELYGIDELSLETVGAVQEGYEKTRKPGFYKHILREKANIESCQVNSLEETPFMETATPDLLMQDLSIVGMFGWIDIEGMSAPTGIDVRSLDDWHHVIDWWFDTYGRYAVAVKSQHAYSRNIDYDAIPPEHAAGAFMKLLHSEPVDPEERKLVEDHLFRYAVTKATEHGLPVKLHTGYYAGQGSMPLSRLVDNPGSASDLARSMPNTTFVFMHICYPYYEELISVAKQYANACIDMCWSWIINPVAAKDFLKKYLITAPANKIVTFGGDYIPVEPVLGHAVIARRGIALALSELVEEGWITTDRAIELIEPIMHENARELFHVNEKATAMKHAPWL